MSQSHQDVMIPSREDIVTASHQEFNKAYRKLYAWQKADELAFQVYKATGVFPKDEIYGLRSQLRRAALSVPTNLVEGTGCQGKKEFKHYVNIALGSLAETEYLIDFSLKLGYFDPKTHQQLCLAKQAVGGLLWNLYRSF
ncbi:MAG: four helix bundle protein [Candidatus Omnitrophota bacterium]